MEGGGEGYARSLPSPSPPPSLSTFFPAAIDEVRSAILSSSDATCSLDLIPTSLLKSCLDAFLLPITTLINLSRSEEHTSELQSRPHLVCRLLLVKKNPPIHSKCPQFSRA